MKFNRLQASISNNADQSPSLYMALCAIESLFADIEDNCGADISHCPVGDERLPSKLVWLCRIINEIYRDNSDDLQRNRSRLDAAMAKLKDTYHSLQESAGVVEHLADLRKEHMALQAKLAAQTAAASEYEDLKARCAQAQQELTRLSAFDPRQARAQLEQLTDEVSSRQAERKDLLEKLAQQQEIYAALQAQQVKYTAAAAEYEDLKARCDLVQQEITRLSAFDPHQAQTELEQLKEDFGEAGRATSLLTASC